MKLYVFPPSPNAVRVLLTAHHLGLEVEIEPIDLLKGDQRTPEFTRRNPNQKMPVLEDGDFLLWESNAIMQYLASKKPESGLWPTDPRKQADVSRWQCWQLAHWGPACGNLIFENFVKGFTGQGDPDPEAVKKGEEEFHKYARVLDGSLAGRRCLVGDSLTLADLSVGTGLHYAKVGKYPMEGYGEIRRWQAGLEKLPAWTKAAPPIPGA